MPDNTWYELDDGRECYDHSLGFKVIRPKDCEDPVPLFCVVCSGPMLTADDINSHRRHSCCASCALRWVDLHREEWSQGWRPSKTEVERELLRRRARAKKINI